MIERDEALGECMSVRRHIATVDHEARITRPSAEVTEDLVIRAILADDEHDVPQRSGLTGAFRNRPWRDVVARSERGRDAARGSTWREAIVLRDRRGEGRQLRRRRDGHDADRSTHGMDIAALPARRALCSPIPRADAE